jgi:hypothetical protein
VKRLTRHRKEVHSYLTRTNQAKPGSSEAALLSGGAVERAM